MEVRVYLSETVSTASLQNSIERLSRQLLLQNLTHGILILTALLPVNNLNNIPARFENIEIWDLVDLNKKVHAHLYLLNRFNELRSAMQIGTVKSPNIPSAISIMEDDSFYYNDKYTNFGANIAEELAASDSGNKNGAGQIFEELCQKALKLIFSRDFTGWRTQSAVEDGHHRLDLIARMVPKSPFWVNLSADFRARYVSFEFKNYGQEITQNQITTTENTYLSLHYGL